MTGCPPLSYSATNQLSGSRASRDPAEALGREGRWADRAAGDDHACLAIEQHHVPVVGGQRRQVVGDTPQRNRRGDDAGAVFPGAIVADRQDDVRGALFAGDQHGAHRRGVAQGFGHRDQARAASPRPRH